MLIYSIPNTSKVHQAVTNNLRTLGVKSRVKRTHLKTDKENRVKKVFGVSLTQQKFDSIKLSTGAVISVPVFVKQAVNYLDLHLNQEGLFRKAGSQTRQRELVARFDNGNELGDKYNAIDVANCLKKYLRDLPEPLIPNEFHDLFVRCGMLKFCKVDAILQACLLLPIKYLTTLAFLMDFFQRVAMYENMNKMGVDNLAKVVGPNIMPVRETTMAAVQNRLNAHLSIIKILIENARKIGVLPKEIMETAMSDSIASPGTDLDHSGSSFKSKRKKHRSGSLTRMFNGLKKIVGKNSPEETISRRSLMPPQPSSPSKSTKKRKIAEVNPSTTSKKKRESNPRALFPSPVSEDPNPTEEKPQKLDKSRKLLNLDRFVSRSRHKLPIELEPERSPVIERRWSMASGVSRNPKKRNSKKSSVSSLLDKRTKSTLTEEYDRIFMEADVNLSDENPDLPRCLTFPPNPSKVPEEYVKIPKKEYEEIKNRVSAIESRIDQELHTIDTIDTFCLDSASEVQSKYERTLGEASIGSITPADQLARRLGKELKIRKGSDGKVIRSPSARKIGNIRRRSQEKPVSKRRISRSASWHISEQPRPLASSQYTQAKEEMGEELGEVCSEETNARLDFLHQQLCTLMSHTAEHTRSSGLGINYESQQITGLASPKVAGLKQVRRASSFHGSSISEVEQKKVYYNLRMSNLKKSNSQRQMQKVIPTSQSDIFTWKNASIYLESEKHTAKSILLRRNGSPGLTQTGRDSVAKLRTQNAGMVLAKAKLFDDECKSQVIAQQRTSSGGSGGKITPPNKNERKKKCRSPKTHEGRLKSDQENSINFNGSGISSEAPTYKTPHIKKPLAVKTPKSTRSLVRRAPIDMKRTPLKAVPLAGTPKRQSPRNAFRARQVTRNIDID
uniref:ARHGAP11A protein n=1 Tax=Fopius arisanus TaxID=64838 RepID=A0A0C9R7K1_9HYME